MATPLRVLLVDCAALVRRRLCELLERDGDAEVVGEAATGAQALQLVGELRPDLVILHVSVGTADGIETTRQIMAYSPTPILVLGAAGSRQGMDATFGILGAGALDVLEAPEAGDAATVEAWGRTLLRRARLLARVKVVTHLRGRRPAGGIVSAPVAEAPRRARAGQQGGAPVVVIGASTGGPGAVRQILTRLPHDFPAAVLVVQHIANGFSAGMAEWLAGAAALPVSLAREGSRLETGKVLIAPDRFDLLVRPGGSLHLSGLPLLLQRPAIDIAMQSVAAVYGEATVGVLLTGMGRDGAVGMQAIRRAGGYTFAQDEASCVIYGMPRAAIELGAADAVLPPAQIAEALCERLAYARRAALR